MTINDLHCKTGKPVTKSMMWWRLWVEKKLYSAWDPRKTGERETKKKQNRHSISVICKAQ